MTKVWNQAAMRHAAYKAERPRKMHAPVNGGEDAKLELRRPEPVPRPNGGHVELTAGNALMADDRVLAAEKIRESLKVGLEIQPTPYLPLGQCRVYYGKYIVVNKRDWEDYQAANP